MQRTHGLERLVFSVLLKFWGPFIGLSTPKFSTITFVCILRHKSVGWLNLGEGSIQSGLHSAGSLNLLLSVNDAHLHPFGQEASEGRYRPRLRDGGHAASMTKRAAEIYIVPILLALILDPVLSCP